MSIKNNGFLSLLTVLTARDSARPATHGTIALARDGRRRVSDATDERDTGRTRGAYPCALRDALSRKPRTPFSRDAASDAHRVPARSRPDYPFRRVPAPRIQDPSLRESRGRLLSHAPDTYDGMRANHAHRGAPVRPQRKDLSRAYSIEWTHPDGCFTAISLQYSHFPVPLLRFFVNAALRS
jgi:hypothetical protein